jgi:hypothetical protein
VIRRKTPMSGRSLSSQQMSSARSSRPLLAKSTACGSDQYETFLLDVHNIPHQSDLDNDAQGYPYYRFELLEIVKGDCTHDVQRTCRTHSQRYIQPRLVCHRSCEQGRQSMNASLSRSHLHLNSSPLFIRFNPSETS